MFGYSKPVWVLTMASFAVWGFALWWALTRPKYRWYQVWLLTLVTLFWWIAETIAIRLGKYRYHEQFPFRVHFPGAGTPGSPGRLEAAILWLLPKGETLPSASNPLCVASSWDIPFPVVALEAALLFGLFRLSVRLLRSETGGRLRAALATAGLSGLLLVNVTAVLDPVVSTTTWCGTVPSTVRDHYLTFGLWEWFTTQTHPGYWFGVPLVNYAGWFLAAATFGFVARLDEERPESRLRRRPLLIAYVAATLVMLLIFFAVLVPVKVGLDLVLVHGQAYLFGPHPGFPTERWQFGVIVGLLAAGLLVAARGRRHHHPEFEWVSSLPKVVVFVFCLALLAIQPDLGIFAIWVTTATIAAVVLLWPFIARSMERRGSWQPAPTSGGNDGVGD
jgi:Carotenoid biosynthesis protein